MATLVLDDLSARQRDLLESLPVLANCEWRGPQGAGFPAYFASLSSKPNGAEPRLTQVGGLGPVVLAGAAA